MRSLADPQEAIVHGAAKRLRPKFMTMATTCIGFVPIMWATGTGSDVWKRIAAPMVGGILTSFVLELIVYPAVYELWKWHSEVKRTLPQPDRADAQVARHGVLSSWEALRFARDHDLLVTVRGGGHKRGGFRYL